MTFIDLEEKNIIPIVYTSYITRRYVLSIVGAPTKYGFSVNVYDTGSGNTYSMPGVGQRTYQNIEGNPITQSFYAKSTIYLYRNAVLTGTNALMKNAVDRLRNIYASASFKKPENYGSSSFEKGQSCSILTVPNVVIGSGIKPGSFSLENFPLTDKVLDDGYGGLYSGSILRGCIFYEHGLAYLSGDFSTNSTFTVQFTASAQTPQTIYICDAPRGMLNFSLNPSYTQLSGTRNEITTEEPKTFITTVGLYDEDYELVGVAKVATPLLNQETDGVQFRLKLNF